MATAKSSPPSNSGLRIGIDLGGTKTEGIVLGPSLSPSAGSTHGASGPTLARRRIASPRQSYAATLDAITNLVAALESDVRATRLPVGIGIPGSLSPSTHLVRNANSTWLNGRALGPDLERRLGSGRTVALANDADCFALSEAIDGAGAGYRTVIGIILGTGVGSGIVIDGRLLGGPLGIAGEWGHTPMPLVAGDQATTADRPMCWCGRRGCVETFLSGPALEAQFAANSGEPASATDIATRAAAGDAIADGMLDAYCQRLATALAGMVNILDPDVIVLGGGLSNIGALYPRVTALMSPHIFSDAPALNLRPPKWGDASGVRGAAWLTG